MLQIDAHATIGCHFQAHTFEDRVLNIDRARIREGASLMGDSVLLYGVDIGSGGWVGPHSAVMKMGRLSEGQRHESAGRSRSVATISDP